MGTLATDQFEPEGHARVKRLVFIAPESKESGIGDHADRLIAVLRAHADQVVDLRHAGPGSSSVLDCIRFRRAVSRALKDGNAADTVLHAELGGGSVAAFWAFVARRNVVRTAALHDPPHPVWMIFRFRLISRSRLLDNALLWALAPLTTWIERRAMRNVGLVAFTAEGTRQVSLSGFGRQVLDARLMAPTPDPVPGPTSRPLAVGLFGYFYRGKGFELVDELRSRLDKRITIRIAGRGTDMMPARQGVEVYGPVEGADQAAFFAAVRVLVLPYRRKVVWHTTMAPASGAFVEAAAYRTPCLALESARLHALEGSGCDTVDGLDSLAKRIEELMFGDDSLARLASEQEEFRKRQSILRTVQPIVSQWQAPG